MAVDLVEEDSVVEEEDSVVDSAVDSVVDSVAMEVDSAMHTMKPSMNMALTTQPMEM